MSRNKICFYGEEFLPPRLTPKLEDYSLSAVRDCLFNIFAATLHIGGRSSIATWGRAMLCHHHHHHHHYYYYYYYYYFFSPGATTPIGDCILQPSSGL